MSSSYDDFAHTFSNSRKNMKWQEIEYFSKFFDGQENLKILDVGCGNARLLNFLLEKQVDFERYFGFDNSQKLLSEIPEYNDDRIDFLYGNMEEHLETLKIYPKTMWIKFDFIFFIASFHHLKTIEERKKVLKDAYSLLENGGMIFMTNWALESEFNKEKYVNSKIPNSTNKFGSSDFDIKIGEFSRFYHSFSLQELEYLFKKTGFKIIENREFEGGKNTISILKK